MISTKDEQVLSHTQLLEFQSHICWLYGFGKKKETQTLDSGVIFFIKMNITKKHDIHEITLNMKCDNAYKVNTWYILSFGYQE